MRKYILSSVLQGISGAFKYSSYFSNFQAIMNTGNRTQKELDFSSNLVFKALDAFNNQLQPAVIADSTAINAQTFFFSDLRCFMKTWNRPLVANMQNAVKCCLSRLLSIIQKFPESNKENISFSRGRKDIFSSTLSAAEVWWCGVEEIGFINRKQFSQNWK